MQYYRLFNLILASSFELNELNSVKKQEPDIVIKRIEESLEIPEVVKEGNYFDHLEYKINNLGYILLRFNDLFDCLIHPDNKHISIKLAKDTQLNTVKLFLLGSVMGFILIKRQKFPLHASAVWSPEGAILFMGHSGAGKSTIATHMLQQGFPIISDDICSIEIKGNQAWVDYAIPQVKLWEKSTEHLGVSTKGVEIVSENRTKYKVQVPHELQQQTFPINAIFQLNIDETLDQIKIQTKQTMNKLKSLIENTYRHHAVEILGLEKLHFKFCSELIRIVPIYLLSKPDNLIFLEEMVEEVMRTIKIKK